MKFNRRKSNRRRGSCLIALLIIIIIVLCCTRCKADEPRINSSKDLRIIYFSVTWCKYCPTQTKIIKEVEKQGVKVRYVDIDNDKTGIVEALHIFSVPTTMIVNVVNGESIEYRTFKGVTSKATILEAMKVQ